MHSEFIIWKCVIYPKLDMLIFHQFFKFFLCIYVILQGLYMEDYIPSREWEVIGYRAERLKTDYGTYNGTQLFRVDIKVFLSIKRHASVLIASYVMPGFGKLFLLLLNYNMFLHMLLKVN